MTFYQALAAILVAMIVIPIVVYISTKAAGYAWHRGKYLFEQDHQLHQKGDRKDASTGTKSP